MIDAIVLDLDGTLLNSEKRVSERNLRAVMECHSRGLSIIIATARPPRSVAMLLPPELLQLSCLIYYNGASTYDLVLGVDDHWHIDQETVRDIYSYISSSRPSLYVCVEAQDTMFADRSLDAGQLAVFGVPNDAPLPTVITMDQMSQLPVSKLLFPNEDHIFAELEVRFRDVVKLILTDGRRLIQIMHPSVSKAAALHNVLARKGLNSAQVVAFGDDMNDLELFDLCGYPVAMGNAIEELKSRAKWITATNDEDGVALVLEKLTEINGPISMKNV